MMKGFNDDVSSIYNYIQEIFDFVEYVKERPIEVRFIEFMPFDSNSWNTKKHLPYKELIKMIS